ncbi:MAG TPA: response regulator [Burkholderiaceae bacterium]|jgi:response regulator NasT
MSSSTMTKSKGKILVVDDDRLVLATLSFGLAQAGFEVIDADNGDDAILLARQHRPGLALLDIRMEGLNGFDVAAYLREQLRIPFIFLSAFADDETVARVKSLGASAYLVKPLDIGQIVPTVEAAFAQGSRQEAPLPTVLNQLVPLAIGTLMQRDQLNRAQALALLQQRADREGLALIEVAQRLIDALEERLKPE